MNTSAATQGRSQTLKQGAEKAAQDMTHSPLVESLTRLGYVVRGIIYVVIGILAFQVAIGNGGALADPQGAVAAIGETPGGGIVLYAILIGLIGYALWGVIRAVFDPLQKGNNLKGIAERLGFAASGLSYGLLAAATFGLISGSANAARNGAQAAQTQQTAASILSQPWGVWAVATAGLIGIGIGLLQIIKGLRGDFDLRFQPYALSSDEQKWFDRLGRFGTAARGVVFTLIGLFLFLAAYHHDANQAQGFNGALAVLLQQPYGPWLLGIVALGLIAFGVYSGMSGLWLRLKR